MYLNFAKRTFRYRKYKQNKTSFVKFFTRYTTLNKMQFAKRDFIAFIFRQEEGLQSKEEGKHNTKK